MILRSSKVRLFAAASSLAVLTLAPQQAAANPDLPEVFNLGENGEGDVCSASRQWTEGEPELRFASQQPFAITCRGIDAAQSLGYVSGISIPGTERCADASVQTIAGLGAVEVRQCFDAALQQVAFDLRFERGGRTWQGAAVARALPNLETALRIIAGGGAIPDRGASPSSAINLDDVPTLPEAQRAQGTGASVNTVQSVFTGGVRALQTGRLLDASRILNDALRQFADSDIPTLIDLRLAAGLADSNVSQFEAAEVHFAAAEALLAAQGAAANAEQQQQLRVYRGLHLINRRQWQRAIEQLTLEDVSGDASLSPTIVSRLNQETLTFGAPSDDAGADDLQSSLGDEAGLQSVLLEAQRYWILSVAQLAIADPDVSGSTSAAEASIRNAATIAAAPISRIPPERIGWLHSAIERQMGRIYARRGDTDRAVASFDCAIAALRGSVPGGSQNCIAPAVARRADLSETSALLLETQLERASIASRDPRRREEALEDYRSSISGIANLDGVGPVSQAALERYFDLMSEARPTEARSAEFFRAMQAIGEPAIAREYAVMQQELAEDDDVRQLLRQRRDLQQERNGLTFAIGALAGSDNAGDRQALETQLSTVNAQLNDVNTQIARTGGISQLDDQTITLAELRATLEPGEVYFKLVELNDAMYGMAISLDDSVYYRIDGSIAEITRDAEAVLSSAQSRYREGSDFPSLIPFDVRGSYELFATIAGPAAHMFTGENAATSVIFDAAGIFRQFPIAMLVTDQASMEDYYSFPDQVGNYNRAQFLVETARTSVSLSPRAFVSGRENRSLSEADYEVIGFANAPVPELTARQQLVAMPFECRVTLGNWANYIYQSQPVAATELAIIAQALGHDSIPQLTGDAFTESALLGDNPAYDLSQYRILHFATHGLPGQNVTFAEDAQECLAYVPPSLVTALSTATAGSPDGADGLLSFAEITRLDLDANLIVLSACDTSASAAALEGRAAGFEFTGAALDGLVRSFLVADARAVMATFWRVPDDQFTFGLMSEFYRAGQDSTIAASLQSAQLSVLENLRTSHPYRWANFFVVGDGANNMFAGRE